MLGLKSKPSHQTFFCCCYFFFFAVLVPSGTHTTINALTISNQVRTTRTNRRIIIRIWSCQRRRNRCARKDTPKENCDEKTANQDRNLGFPRTKYCDSVTHSSPTIRIVLERITSILSSTIVLMANEATVTSTGNKASSIATLVCLIIFTLAVHDD